MKQLPNLDAMSSDELFEFHKLYVHHKESPYTLLAPKDTMEEILCHSVVLFATNYAWHAALAQELRLLGSIEKALEQEAKAQENYDQIPQEARW